jgi:hypothetical protein
VSGLHLNNSGTLSLESALRAALDSSTDVVILNSGNLSVNGDVLVIGNLTLETASGADVTLAQDIRVENGEFSATAGHDIHLVDNTSVNSDVTIVGSDSVAVFRAAEEILFGQGYVVMTDDGRFSHFPLVENVTFFVEPQDKGGSNINGAGEVTIEVIAGVDGELNYEFEINWFDGTVEVNPPADDGSTQFDGNTPYLFSHEYGANPDSENASAPVPVSVIIRWNPRAEGQHGVQFYANGEPTRQATTTVGRTQTVSGEGIQSFVFTFESEIEAAPERRQSTTTAAEQSVTSTVKVQETLVGSRREAETNAIARRRVYFQEVDELSGKLKGNPEEISSGQLPNLVDRLEDASLSNGRYRVFVQEANSSRSRTIMDVNVADGKVVPRGYRSNSADQQPDSTGVVVEPPSKPQNREGEASNNGEESGEVVNPDPNAGAALNFQGGSETIRVVGESGRSAALGSTGLLIASRMRRRLRDAEANGKMSRASRT